MYYYIGFLRLPHQISLGISRLTPGGYGSGSHLIFQPHPYVRWLPHHPQDLSDGLHSPQIILLFWFSSCRSVDPVFYA